MKFFSITDIKQILNDLNATKKKIQEQANKREGLIFKSILCTIFGVSGVLGFYSLAASTGILIMGLTFLLFGYLLTLGSDFMETSIKKKLKFYDYEKTIYEVLEQDSAQKAILTYITDSYNQNNPYLKLEIINELKLYLINKNYNNALLLISNMFNLIEDYQEEQKLINSYDKKLGLPIIEKEQEIELGSNVKWAKLL